MAVDLMQIALGFLADYGLYAVFVLLVLDGAMLMPVLPGEAVMIMAVTQYAHSASDLVMLILLATAAAIVGSLILYGIARVGGRPLIDRHPRLFMMDKRRRESLERTFEKPLGQSLVMFLRLIPLTRIVVNIPAGLARMGLGRFLVLSSIGMALFHGGFMWLAYEYQQPGSGVAQQATALQEAYATPAWQYLQTHEAVGILGAVLLGAYFSFKSSRRMLKHPDGAIMSILGWLAVRVLLIGSIVVGAVAYVQPDFVYQLALAGGLDIPALAARVDLPPIELLAYALTTAVGIGFFLRILEGQAKKARARASAMNEIPELEELDGDDGASTNGEGSGSSVDELDFEEGSS